MFRRLNVFYLTLEKLQAFASGRYDLSIDPQAIENNYVQQLADTAEQLEALSIRRPAQSSGELNQVTQQLALTPGSSQPAFLELTVPLALYPLLEGRVASQPTHPRAVAA